MATVFSKYTVRILALTLALLTSAHALENADAVKSVADLKSENPQVRAAALTVLTPLYTDLQWAFFRASNDKAPEVEAAYVNSMKQVGDWGLRRVRNELAAVYACKTYITAQDIYIGTDWNKDGILEYAQAFRGKDSLYETTPGAGDIALIDRAFANAEGEPGKASPKDGYCFKILTKQSRNRSYIKDGHMVLGNALVAYPAEYGKSGNRCFLISNQGTIFAKDLGPETLAQIEKMTAFNPETWMVEENY